MQTGSGCNNKSLPSVVWIPHRATPPPKAEDDDDEEHHPYLLLGHDGRNAEVRLDGSCRGAGIHGGECPLLEGGDALGGCTSASAQISDREDASESKLLLDTKFSSLSLSTSARCELLTHLSKLSPSANKMVLTTLKKMKRLRLALMDPLRGVTADYNRDAGKGTLMELVKRTELAAECCVDDLLKLQPDMHSWESVLRSSTEDALAEFYVDLCVLMEECGDWDVVDMLSCSGDASVSLEDAIQCCYAVSRDHVREVLGLLPHVR